MLDIWSDSFLGERFSLKCVDKTEEMARILLFTYESNLHHLAVGAERDGGISSDQCAIRPR